jgi:hypothetical protein
VHRLDQISDNNRRIEGTRIKHTVGPVSIKMYDKFRLILRIETTVVNVSFFKHYREVEPGTREAGQASHPLRTFHSCSQGFTSLRQ